MMITNETNSSFAGSAPAEPSKQQTTIIALFIKARRALTQRQAPQPNKNRKRKSDDTEKGRGTPTPAATARNARRTVRSAFRQARQTAQRVTSCSADAAMFLSDTLDGFWFNHWHSEHSTNAGSDQPSENCATSNHLSPHL